MKLIPILDNGHGGMIAGVYQTPGKRSPNWAKGVLHEGAFNRWIVNRLTEKLDRNDIPYYRVSSEDRDVTLQTRCNRANKIYSKDRSTYLLSIHANAGGGTGTEGFTSPGQTRSDAIAEYFLRNWDEQFDVRMRYGLGDGDRDKEARFRMLTHTNCPAYLHEVLFMDHPDDYELLWSVDFADQVAENLFWTIKELYEQGI